MMDWLVVVLRKVVFMGWGDFVGTFMWKNIVGAVREYCWCCEI